MNFACLYMPDFRLQASLRGESSEARALDQAIALVEGSSSCPRVVAATRKAREAGIALGMTKAQAAQLASIRHRSRAQEDSAHAALLDCARSCSPRVEDTAADTVVMDLDGLEKLLGPPSRIATRLLGQTEEVGLIVHVAIAANPDTAILAARGFRGATIIPPGEEARKLAELPVSVLNPQPETLDTLRRWGIYRLKELAGLPPLPLSERLGQEGVRLQRLARGEHFRSLMIAGEAERFEESWELEDPAATLDELDFVLSSLLARLSKRLAMRSLATQEMRLRLDLAEGMEPEPSLALEEMACKPGVSNSSLHQVAEKGSGACHSERGEESTLLSLNMASRCFAPLSMTKSVFSATCYERSLHFPLPVCNAKLFFKLWRLRLESDLPSKPVVRIRIIAEPAKPRAIQGGLFAPLAPDPEKLELTLARIAAVVGSSNVGSPELVDTHKPHAFRMTEFNPAESSRVVHKASQRGIHMGDRIAVGEGFGTMSLRLFRPPMLIRVELNSGRPTRIFSSQVRGRIVFAAGPWRKSGGWWEEEKWGREEWDIEMRTGDKMALYSIYYDLARDEWYLQGEYD